MKGPVKEQKGPHGVLAGKPFDKVISLIRVSPRSSLEPYER
jgi:hypothetical protein